MTADELRALLAPHGIRPIRERGQHFLLDEGVVRDMATAAEVGPGSLVVEVGPGPGILTAELLRRGATVVAVELDRKFWVLLKERFGASPNFHLFTGDALGFPNAALVGPFGAPEYKVVANLPYAITSDALRKFLLEDPCPASVTVMVQREVADRILAPAGEMSAIAVMVRTLAAVSRVVNVPASSFLPPPRVDSAVIHISRKDDRTLEEVFAGLEPDRYFAIVRAAFAGKRKQLKNSLRSLVIDENRLSKGFSEAGIAPETRPETLSPEDWRRLIHALTR